MTMIVLTDESWDQVTLTVAEIWQCRSHGTVLVSNESITDPSQGIELGYRDSRIFAAGSTVHFRRISPSLATNNIIHLCREAL